MWYAVSLTRVSMLLSLAAALLWVSGCKGGYGGSGGGGNPPSAPTGLTATAGNAQVNLAWTAASGATGYYVKRSTTGGAETQIAAQAGTTYSDTAVTNGTKYFYVVSAYNSYGASANSAEVNATPAPPPPPAVPTGLVATPGNTQVGLIWNASTSATSYNVKRSTTTGGPYTTVNSPNVTNFIDTGLTNGTKYFYVVSAVNSAGESGNSSEVNAIPLAPGTPIAVTIDPLSNRHPINPNIYGGSYPKDAATITDTGLTVVRWGGNATSTYNWQLFTNNADNDYFWEDFTSSALNNSADADSTQFIKDVITAKSNPLTTMAMLPWVAKSAENGSNKHWSFSVAKYGAQCSVDPFNADAGNGQKTDCSTPVATADPNDAYFPLLDDHTKTCPAGTTCEYRSDWGAALASAFGTAPHFYDMDNEIDIWAGTHRDIHPANTTYNELRDIYLTESRALKGWDPLANRFGPVSCCWYFYWRSATGGGDTSGHGGVDFLPWWLNEVAWSDAVAGSRSLDVFDIHAYPDGPDTKSFTLAQKQAAALRVYRDWWDPNYTSEASYIVGGGFSIQPVDSKPFRIPRMRALLHTIYPGTQFSITEWSAELAGSADFSTALGDAEAYGILGRERVDLASRWTAPDPPNPNYQALKLYRNYDGSHSTFGQTSISATHTADPNLFSVFAALSKTGPPLTIMVVNKDPANAAQVTFALNGFTTGTFTSYTLSQASPASIVASSSQIWNKTQTFPPYSATLLVVTGAPNAAPVAEWDLNPDSIQIPAGGSFTFQPMITTATSGSANVNLSTAQFDASPAGLSLSITKSSITPTPLTGNGAITVTAASSVNPGFYHFTVTGSDGTATQTQGGWALVQKPAATMAKTGDNQTGLHGTTLTFSATLSAGSSGGTNTGASILFSTDAGNFIGASKTIVTTDASGKATVTLTLPATAGTVHVTAEGPFGLGHPVVTFTETAN
jgi:hypothetical protein